MSWRINWYKADKENPLKITKEDNGEGGYYEYAEVNGELLLFGEGTDMWTSMTDEERYNKELFIELKKDDDCDYFEVTRKGLELFIKKYRERIVNVYEEAMKSDEERNWSFPNVQQYHEQKLWEWQKDLVYDLRPEISDRPYNITNSFKYEYSIFNLIAIHKFFDFDNYKLVIYGG